MTQMTAAYLKTPHVTKSIDSKQLSTYMNMGEDFEKLDIVNFCR